LLRPTAIAVHDKRYMVRNGAASQCLIHNVPHNTLLLLPDRAGVRGARWWRGFEVGGLGGYGGGCGGGGYDRGGLAAVEAGAGAGAGGLTMILLEFWRMPERFSLTLLRLKKRLSN